VIGGIQELVDAGSSYVLGRTLKPIASEGKPGHAPQARGAQFVAIGAATGRRLTADMIARIWKRSR